MGRRRLRRRSPFAGVRDPVRVPQKMSGSGRPSAAASARRHCSSSRADRGQPVARSPSFARSTARLSTRWSGRRRRSGTGNGWPSLPAVRERKARRIGEPAGRPVDDLRHQRQREQRARADARHQQQLREVLRAALGDRRQRPPSRREIDVAGAHVVVRGHAQPRQAAEARLGRRACQADHLGARAPAGRRSTRLTMSPAGSPSIAAWGSSTKLPARAPRSSGSGAPAGARCSSPAAPPSTPPSSATMKPCRYRSKPSWTAALSTFATSRLARTSAGASSPMRSPSAVQLVGRAAGVAAAAAAHVQPELARHRREPALERADDAGRDARRVPVHPHDGTRTTETRTGSPAGAAPRRGRTRARSPRR